ncbi:hypothetical protein SNE40_013151 [Patella caerulea]|uniref:PHD-type domain-containing protein n=1 Tax=Patella caerulea TaxID=87958 RepID=A0AAN8JMZ8_PATCE
MASGNCVKCTNPVRPRQEGLQCDSCLLWQHRTCDSGITRDEYTSLNRHRTAFEWKCCRCVAPLPPTEEEIDIEESFTVERPYQLPDPVIESSMSEDEQDISVFAEEEPELAYTIEEAATTRGKKKLFDNIGFAYTIKTDKKTTVWRCCKRKIPLDLTMMSEGSLRRHQRRRYRHVEGQLFKIWDEYNEKQMSTSRLLKKISHLYGPPAQ